MHTGTSCINLCKTRTTTFIYTWPWQRVLTKSHKCLIWLIQNWWSDHKGDWRSSGCELQLGYNQWQRRTRPVTELFSPDSAKSSTMTQYAHKLQYSETSILRPPLGPWETGLLITTLLMLRLIQLGKIHY